MKIPASAERETTVILEFMSLLIVVEDTTTTFSYQFVYIFLFYYTLENDT